MANLTFKVGHVYCYGCVKGLGDFIGKMRGVQSINVKNNDSVFIEYNPQELEVDEEKFKTIVQQSIERLGFRIRKY